MVVCEMASAIPNLHLPPHLREVCSVLALGLVRLRRRSAEDFNRDLGVHGESSLHFDQDQSGHSTPEEGQLA
jgi:hypothetical protein